MSDLSGLNPTPHAIAVYASSPLSPVATQHSLPSGRYSLLGPDFHRLDRTSLRLAHSFDHLVGCYSRNGQWNIGGGSFRLDARLLNDGAPPSVSDASSGGKFGRGGRSDRGRRSLRTALS